MCDTFVIDATASADGVAVLAKNSDRDPNEAQFIDIVPARDHPAGGRLRCTYIEIPQVRHTHAVVLSRPFWMWGAEMGFNEMGVAIGNEAVFSRVSPARRPALLGMDLVRLALERGATAAEAMRVIIDLLETYGQGGNGGYGRRLYYHNSFLIADPHESWVLETVGKQWASRRVNGAYAISNAYSIGSQFDAHSIRLISQAIERGWCREQQAFDLQRCYSDWFYTTFAYGAKRRTRVSALLGTKSTRMSIADAFAILRDHGGSDHPSQGLTGVSVCMHASRGPIRFSQTTASLVVYLHPDRPLGFATGTAAPCTAIFKPVWCDGVTFEPQNDPDGRYNPDTLYWRHERLHRRILSNFNQYMPLLRTEQEELESRFIASGLQMIAEKAELRHQWSRTCFQTADEMETRWLERIRRVAPVPSMGIAYRRAWRRFNRRAGIRENEL